MEKKLFDILKERGYVKDLTHEREIIDLVNGKPMTFYLGIDPTADSLHIGHFFALTMFRWLQDFGHHGIILIGGATALIGDPTGKSDMRKMLSKEEVIHNKKEVKEIIPCPNCKGTIIEKKTKKGKIFYGCNNYPKCNFASWDKPLIEKCPECGGVLVEKKDKIKCLSCDYEK